MFYTFLGLIELKLAESQLNSHLQPGMAHVLLRLYESDNCIIKDIGRSLRVANGTLTGLLNRMQKAGLIQCRRCRNDGRATRVTLTPLGRSLEPRVREFHREVNAIVEHGFTSAEIAAGKSFMARMLDSLRSAEESLRLKSEKISTTTKRRPRSH
ncbi:MAG: MarR family transcriptional regulator [Verrucomicrobiae bacterium]|nr:MarR family transcriptional regulator [Verrucomicrobiae bacterium]